MLAIFLIVFLVSFGERAGRRHLIHCNTSEAIALGSQVRLTIEIHAFSQQ